MRIWVAAAVVMLVVGVVTWIVGDDSALTTGVSLSLVGIASVIGVSLVFYAVGKAEDAERAAAAAPPPEAEDEETPAEDPHPRPALDRRRPMPPRRPS